MPQFPHIMGDVQSFGPSCIKTSDHTIVVWCSVVLEDLVTGILLGIAWAEAYVANHKQSSPDVAKPQSSVLH